MNDEQLMHGIGKGLEVWTLQNMTDGAILLCFVALALIGGRAYLEHARRRLSLRVATELWDLTSDYLADAVLLVVVLIGLFVTNPDIMADIKIALPWVPIAFVLAGVALVLRTCHNGRAVASRSWWVALVCLGLGCLSAWFGFTFVMEAATGEYFEIGQAPAIWANLQHMRSDFNHPLALSTFFWAAPALALLFGWAIVAGVYQTLRQEPGAVETRRGRTTDVGSGEIKE